MQMVEIITIEKAELIRLIDTSDFAGPSKKLLVHLKAAADHDESPKSRSI